MKLYEHPESGNSHKVRLLLSFLGLEYESVIVDLMADEQHQSPFLAVNPRGEVPVLVDNEVVLRDSMAILTYLATQYDERRQWLPTDNAGTASVMEWLAFAASWIQFGVFTARALVSFGISGNGLPHTFKSDIEEARIRGTNVADDYGEAIVRARLAVRRQTHDCRCGLLSVYRARAHGRCFPGALPRGPCLDCPVQTIARLSHHAGIRRSGLSKGLGRWHSCR